MADAYCVKCKAKHPMSDALEVTMKNGRKAVKGKCPVCGTVMFKMLGGKGGPGADAAPQVPPDSSAPPPAA
jgi:RNase P subunit RPR2